jgi:carbamoyl-phosphate synthase large subunit
MTQTIYVSGVSGIVGYGIVNSLKLSGRKLKIVGSCLDNYNYGSFMVDQNFIAPLTSNPDYISWMVELITSNKILFAIPGIEIDVHTWNENRDVIVNSGCQPLLNASRLISLTRDKFEFYKDVESRNFPHTIPTSDSLEFHEVYKTLQTHNLIAKPKIGFARKGFEKLENEFAFEKFVSSAPNGYVFQPNLESDGFEYTSGIFGDGLGGFSASITLRRRLATAGYTEYAEAVDEPSINEIILDYCRLYSPKGPTNFQFMKSDNQFYLLEINPRFSSSNSIRTLLGFNEAEMLLNYICDGELPKQPKVKYSKVVRYISDTLV